MNRIARLLSRPLAAFVAALLVHIALVFWIGHYKNPIVWENGAIAQNLLDGNGFSILFVGEHSQPTSWQAPGYPYLLLAAWRCFGQNTASYLAISLLQAMLVSSMVFPVGWLTERWFGRRAAILARWVVCFMPLYGWYPTRLVQAPLVIAFHPWILAGWLRVRERGCTGEAVAVGAGTGIAGLFQPVMLLVFGAVSALLAVGAVRRRETRPLMLILLAGCCTLAVLAPWTVRNYAVHGRLIPVKNSFGKEFWMGNNPYATGSAFADGGEKDVWAAHPPQCLGACKGANEIEVMDALLLEALDDVKARPGAFLQRTGKKILWFWTAVPKRLLRVAFEGEAVRFWWLHTGYWFAFLILATTARLRGGRFPPEYAMVLWVYGIAYSIVYGLTIVGNARFRGEIEYILIPAVAAGIAHMWNLMMGKFQGSR